MPRPFLLAALLALATPAAAQTPLPPCPTNLGLEGEVLEGSYNAITAPSAFDHVTTDDQRLALLPEAGNGLSLLALPKPAAADGSPIPVEFLASDGTSLGACAVHATAFDPMRHDTNQMQVGNCDMKLVAGLPQLRVGHLQAWRLPAGPAGSSASPKRVMEVMTLDDDQIMPSGNTPGLAILHWGLQDQPGFNLCPVTVLPAPDTIPDSALCRDPQGHPLRLTQGQTATVQARNPDGTIFQTDQFMAQAPAIATTTGFDKAAQGPIIQAMSPGSTSIALLSGSGEHVLAHVCEVVFE